MPNDSRRHAANLLSAVLRQQQPLDAAFANDPTIIRLPVRDRAFIRNLIATTIRRLGQIDGAIDRCLQSPLPKKANIARDILRLGACQLLFLNVADHAAVDTAVDLAHDIGQGHYAKLINAILRRLAREGAVIVAGQDAARLSTPDWLWQAWSDTYGDAQCRAIAEAHMVPAGLDFSVRGEPSLWLEPLQARLVGVGTLRRAGGGDVTQLPGFDDGAWWVQDAAARIVAGLLGKIAGETVIDLCAAPGGKTAYLAAAGASVIAVDRSAKRLETVVTNLRRLCLSAETVAADGETWKPQSPVDAVLLDAPCSATGTIRRHPDVAHLKSPDDVKNLSALQARLLAAAFEMLKPGGRLVYCTCSLQPEEGDAVVDEFLGSRGDVRLDQILANEIGGDACMIDTRGHFRSLPCHFSELGGIDGFFPVRWL